MKRTWRHSALRQWQRWLGVVLLLGMTACASFHRGALPGEPRTATFAEVGGARVRYIDLGEGPPVVLVHGFASSLDSWRMVSRELAKKHRVIALDLKGFGWTDRPPGDYSPAAQGALVFALLDRLKIDRFALVAHSWGSSVALEMALAKPQRIERLALYDAWVFEEQLPSAFLWARADGVGELIFGLFYKERLDDKMPAAFFDPARISQDRLDAVEASLERPGSTAAALAAARGQRFETIEKRYREINAPVLLLWGREDRITPLAYGERLLSELPHARLRVYPRCGHFPMLEAVGASNADLLAFLGEPAPASASTATAHDPAPLASPAAAADHPAPTPDQPVKPEPVKPEPVKPEPRKPEPVKPEPRKPEPAERRPRGTPDAPFDPTAAGAP